MTRLNRVDANVGNFRDDLRGIRTFARRLLYGVVLLGVIIGVLVYLLVNQARVSSVAHQTHVAFTQNCISANERSTIQKDVLWDGAIITQFKIGERTGTSAQRAQTDAFLRRLEAAVNVVFAQRNCKTGGAITPSTTTP